MRHVPLLILVASSVGCGGGGGAGEAGPDTTSAKAKRDREFAEYAATHGIEALSGGGEAVEVTADGLRLEALDKTKPVKLDGVLDEWPAPAKTTTVVKGATKAVLKIALQYDDAKLYIGADVTDAAFEAGKDHVSLVFAVPTPGGGYAPY